MKKSKKNSPKVQQMKKDTDFWKLESDAQQQVPDFMFSDSTRSLLHFLSNRKKRKFMETLNKIHRLNQSPEYRLAVRRRQYFAYSAVFIVMLIIGASFLFFEKKTTLTDIFNTYYDIESASLIMRSESMFPDAILASGMENFESGRYTEALEAFNQLPDNLMATFYSGLANIETHDYSQAIDNFEQVIHHQNNLFIDQAEWYLALVYLRTNKKSKAVELLEHISSDRGFYRTKAQKILKDLRIKTN